MENWNDHTERPMIHPPRIQLNRFAGKSVISANGKFENGGRGEEGNLFARLISLPSPLSSAPRAIIDTGREIFHADGKN